MRAEVDAFLSASNYKATVFGLGTPFLQKLSTESSWIGPHKKLRGWQTLTRSRTYIKDDNLLQARERVYVLSAPGRVECFWCKTMRLLLSHKYKKNACISRFFQRLFIFEIEPRWKDYTKYSVSINIHRYSFPAICQGRSWQTVSVLEILGALSFDEDFIQSIVHNHIGKCIHV